MRTFQFKIFIFFIFFPALIMAQSDFSSGDCQGAIFLQDTLWSVNEPVSGPGNILEFKDYNLRDPYHFQKEHNTVWFKFKAINTTDIAMDIKPASPEYDIDFLVFKYEPDLCNKIVSKSAIPYRSNLSRSNFSNEGNTGLSFFATEEYIVSGPGERYSKSIQATKGEEYIIVIDNLSDKNKGFNLLLHYKEYSKPLKKKAEKKPEPVPVIKDTVITQPPVKVKEEKAFLNIKVADEKSGEMVKANIVIDYNPPNKQIKVKDSSTFKLELQKSKYYSVSFNAPGYVFFNSGFSTLAIPKEVNMEVKLKKIEDGGKITLQNINFKGDGVEFLPSSIPSLQNLYNFLIQNKDVKIEIIGHVNGPDSKNTLKHQNLSTDRAFAVYDQLIIKGIEKKRLRYKGMGNTEMIYPNPEKDQEAEANRRVEIMIISNKK